MKKAHHILMKQLEHLVHGLETGEEQQIHQHQVESVVDPEQKVHES
jgi:hypothetical protein